MVDVDNINVKFLLESNIGIKVEKTRIFDIIMVRNYIYLSGYYSGIHPKYKNVVCVYSNRYDSLKERLKYMLYKKYSCHYSVDCDCLHGMSIPVKEI